MTQTEPSIKDPYKEKVSGELFRGIAIKALNTFLPERCYSCGEIVSSSGGLCGACWEKITFITAPHCDRCARPFEFDPRFDLAEDLQCADCLRKSPIYDRARSCMVYDAGSRSAILSFKHSDRTDMAPVLAGWLRRSGSELLDASEMIVPVPLHWSRLWSRKFNQSAELARHVAEISDKPYAPDVIRRKRRTPSQAGLGAKARAKNVRGAFSVSKKSALKVSGKRILLIDDVMTTGSTLNACAGSLLWAGAEAVDVLTLARVVRAEPE